MTTTPRYPSTADLAAFRAALLAPSLRATGSPVPDPPAVTPSRYDDEARPLFTDPLARPVSGAWADERRNGIGGRGVRHGHWYTAGDDHAEARREAAAMRSRAYEREYGSWQYACNVARDRGYDAGDWRPFIATEPDRAAHQAFVPR